MHSSRNRKGAPLTAVAGTSSIDQRARDPRLLHEVLESLPQGVLMFDADGQLLFRNVKFIETYGYAPDELRLGLSFHDLITLRTADGAMSDEHRQYCDELLAAMRDGRTLSGYHQTPDGRTIHYINTPIPSGGWIITHEDVTKQRWAEGQLAHMASHDSLTDLPNRATFSAHLEQALRFNPRGTLLAVMFLDLDNFKGVNDTLGHPIGDELLKTVADRLRACMRNTDLVARFGGDEFVVVSTALEQPSDAVVLAMRIRETILEAYSLNEHHVVVDTSIGIALSPNDGMDAQQLLKNADLALYSAKESGRGTFRFFEHAMDLRMMERRKVELELRAAFVNGEFEIHYQPLINLAKNRITSCEALLRWNHPSGKGISPQIFIPIAEEIGLITRLGEWVIRSACKEAAEWPDDVTVAVNVSPVQFRSQNLVQIVVHALALSGLAPNRLEVEITEALLLDHTEDTLAILHQLHALGVRIVMDDFGTGYSSLSYLQKFPFDKIKIDQAFISGLATGNESAAIVSAVTGIAGSFHMDTTAEGVETEEQRAIVTALGCTEMQGHLFSAARTAGEIVAMLAAQSSPPGRAPRDLSPSASRHAPRPSRKNRCNSHHRPAA